MKKNAIDFQIFFHNANLFFLIVCVSLSGCGKMKTFSLKQDADIHTPL